MGYSRYDGGSSGGYAGSDAGVVRDSLLYVAALLSQGGVAGCLRLHPTLGRGTAVGVLRAPEVTLVLVGPMGSVADCCWGYSSTVRVTR